MCSFIILCHKIIFKQGKTYIDSLGWIKNKKITINPINKKYECFQDAKNGHVRSWRNNKRSPKNNKN